MMKRLVNGLLIMMVLSVTFAACNQNKKSSTSTTEEAKTEAVQEEIVDDTATSDDSDDATTYEVIKIKTSKGDMIAKLYNETPKHRDNFVKLTKEGFYNGLIFHRVIKDFMIQGGDPNSKNAKPNQMYGDGGPGYTIPAEINANKFWHKKGALSAARMGDQVNPKKESSGSQFYIVQGKKVTDAEFANYQAYGYSFNEEQKKSYKEIGGTPHLDREYTVFGEVVKGLHVIDAIASVPTNPQLGDRPLTDVKMEIEHLGKMTNEEIQKL